MRAREALLIGSLAVGLSILVTVVRDPQRRVGAMVVVEVPVRAAPRHAPALAQVIDACRERTDNLRATLETLIRVWPGRAKLPEPPTGWPAWPEPGSARKWQRDGW